MKIRFYNARIMTMEQGCEIQQGELAVVDDRIAYVGPERTAEQLAGSRWDREVDVKGDVLMPGFKNAHTHSAMTFLRSFADRLIYLLQRQRQENV